MNTKFNIYKLKPCEEGLAYFNSQATIEEAWNNCPRGDWLLWVAKQLKVDEALIQKATIAANQDANLCREILTNAVFRIIYEIETSEFERQHCRSILYAGCGNTSVIFDMQSQKTFVYEINSQQIHDLYGGKQTYISMSGLSREGWIPRRLNLLQLNTARTDCVRMQSATRINNLFVYLLYDRLNHTIGKFIVSDGMKIAMVSEDNLLKTLNDFNSAFEKSFTFALKYYIPDADLNPVEHVINITCTKGFKGVNADRFADLRYARQLTISASLKVDKTFNKSTYTGSSNKLYKIGDKYYRLNSNGLYTDVYDSVKQFYTLTGGGFFKKSGQQTMFYEKSKYNNETLYAFFETGTARGFGKEYNRIEFFTRIEEIYDIYAKRLFTK
ncbi:MAG: hypothetical protein LBE11_06910 [Prevotellaceae bacterium]|jgi:hypothetical protein|nr:hypothetical protein [Prevotellaceae bacterium]